MAADTKSPTKTDYPAWKIAERTSPLNWQVAPEKEITLQKTSANLTKILASQRQAIKELAQINQLRATLKNSVTHQIETSLKNTLAGSQLRDLVDNRGTQAELDRIINHLTLNPHQNIIHLTDAVAKEVIAASDHRLQLLARLATKNAQDGRGDIQQNLIDAIKQDPEADLAFKLTQSKQIDGTESNQIRESLKQAVLNESSGRPRINGVSDLVEDKLSAAILTHSSLTKQEARDLIDQADITHRLSLSVDERDKLADSITLVSASLDQNEDIADAKAQLVADGVDADTLSINLQSAGATASDMISESYESNSSSRPKIGLDIRSVRLVSKIVANQDLLNNPSTYQELLEMPRFSPSEFVQQWRTFFKPELNSTIASQSPPSFFSIPQEFGSEAGSMLQNAGSQFQVGGRNFLDSVRSLFGDGGSPLGGGFGSNTSGLGNSLKNMFSKIGFGGRSAAGGGALASSSTTAAAAGGATAGWPIAAIIIGIILIIAIIYMLAGASPQKAAMSQIDYIAGSTGGGLVIENPYISGTKTANPIQLENPTGAITYTYSIFAKQGPLTAISATDQVSILQTSGLRQQPLAIPAPPATIDSSWTSDPFAFPLAAHMNDAAIINTITISATAPDGSIQQINLVVTTVIGNPPAGCFVFAEPPAPNSQVGAVSWLSAPSDHSKEIAAAVTIMAAFGGTSSKLCPISAPPDSDPINLYLAASGVSIDYGGWFLTDGNIALDYNASGNGVGSPSNALYTLAHESGHVYNERTGISGGSFRQAEFWTGSCYDNNIYPFPDLIDSEAKCYTENFSEGFARYINPNTQHGPLPDDWRAWFQANVFDIE